MRRFKIGWTKYDVSDGLGAKCTARHCSVSTFFFFFYPEWSCDPSLFHSTQMNSTQIKTLSHFLLRRENTLMKLLKWAVSSKIKAQYFFLEIYFKIPFLKGGGETADRATTQSKQPCDPLGRNPPVEKQWSLSTRHFAVGSQTERDIHWNNCQQVPSVWLVVKSVTKLIRCFIFLPILSTFVQEQTETFQH